MSWLERAAALLAQKQVEYSAKGYPAGAVRGALERARGAAEAKSEPISPAIREQAFYDILVGELRQAEGWMRGSLAFANGTGTDNSEEGGGE